MKLAIEIFNQEEEVKFSLPEGWYTQIDNLLTMEIIDHLVDEILAVTEESERGGLQPTNDYTKFPEDEAREWQTKRQQKQAGINLRGKKRKFPVDTEVVPSSPLTYPTPSPHSRGAVYEEWTLYVGNLDKDITEKELITTFTTTNFPLKSARITKDRNAKKGQDSRSRGFGFVSFHNKADMETCLLQYQGKEIRGNKIVLQRAANGERDKKRLKRLKGAKHLPQSHFYVPRPPRGHGPPQRSSLDVFIGYLPPEATETEVKQACQTFGRVCVVRLQRDKHTKVSYCYGFVHFADNKSKEKALKQGSVQVMGKSCIIKSTTRDKHEEGPFIIRVTPFHAHEKSQFNQRANKAMLAQYFMHFGAIKNIQMTTGEAIIEFYQKASQGTALANMNGQILNSNFGSIQVSVSAVEQKPIPPSSECSIYVPDIPLAIEKPQLFQTFVQFGGIQDLTITQKKPDVQSVIITYKERESQIKAVAAKSISNNGMTYKIQLFKDADTRKAEHQISLSNIPINTSEAQLREALTQEFGLVKKMWLNPKIGSATVHFKAVEATNKAIKTGVMRLGNGNDLLFIERFEKLVIGRTLHISNLPKIVSDQELRTYLENLIGEGNGISTMMVKWPTVNVLFETQSNAERAYSIVKDKIYKGNRLSVEFHQRSLIGKKKNFGRNIDKTIWIGGLGPGVKRNHIEVKCSVFGRVMDLRLKNNMAVVTFQLLESAQRAVAEMNGKMILGTTWIVRPYGREQMPQHPRFYPPVNSGFSQQFNRGGNPKFDHRKHYKR